MDALLADLVVGLHFAFILFALFGAALLPRWPWLIRAHLPALAWGIWIEASGRICPLTPLENHYRERAGAGGYEGGFIDHYLTPIIYPEGLTHEKQLAFGGILIAINILLYWRWLRGRSRAG